MMYFTAHCDFLPGKEEELDRLLSERVKTFWLAQPGVRGFHVYADSLVGWPERTIIIELDDLATLQRILDSAEQKEIRRAFMNYTTNVQSQILNKLV